MCVGLGPAWEADDHGYKSNEIIARRQYNKALSLWHDEDGTALDISGKDHSLNLRRHAGWSSMWMSHGYCKSSSAKADV